MIPQQGGEFEIGFIAEKAGQRLKDLKRLAKTLDTSFPTDALTGLKLVAWTGGNSIGFWLVFEKFQEDYLNQLERCVGEHQLRVIEVMDKSHQERKHLREEFIFTADLKFIGCYDLDAAFAVMEEKLKSGQERWLKPSDFLPSMKKPGRI